MSKLTFKQPLASCRQLCIYHSAFFLVVHQSVFSCCPHLKTAVLHVDFYTVFPIEV